MSELLLLLWPACGLFGFYHLIATDMLWDDPKTRGYLMNDGSWIFMCPAACVAGPLAIVACLVRKQGW